MLDKDQETNTLVFYVQLLVYIRIRCMCKNSAFTILLWYNSRFSIKQFTIINIFAIQITTPYKIRIS